MVTPRLTPKIAVPRLTRVVWALLLLQLLGCGPSPDISPPRAITYTFDAPTRGIDPAPGRRRPRVPRTRISTGTSRGSRCRKACSLMSPLCWDSPPRARYPRCCSWMLPGCSGTGWPGGSMNWNAPRSLTGRSWCRRWRRPSPCPWPTSPAGRASSWWPCPLTSRATSSSIAGIS